jgi:hypothetical protein
LTQRINILIILCLCRIKIEMTTLWNAANGPSTHAELIGRAWMKLGHKLKVFSTKNMR